MSKEISAELQSASAGGDFWAFIRRLLDSSTIHIDRPKGSRHPHFPQVIYPLDYGYLEHTTTLDGGGIDVWVGTEMEKALSGLVCTVDLLKRDTEVKILAGCTSEEIHTILAFHNRNSMRAVLLQPSGNPLDLLLTRRSVRRFQGEEIPRSTLDEILAAAVRAPSAHNSQPWRFAALTGLDAKRQLANRMGEEFRRDLLADGFAPEEADAQVQRSRERILQAPVVIVLCLDISVGDRYPDPQRQGAEFLMAVQGVAMAGENLLLAAHAYGLGGVWVCAPLFAPSAVRLALDLPAEWRPQGLILLGKPARVKPFRSRRPLEEVVLYR